MKTRTGFVSNSSSSSFVVSVPKGMGKTKIKIEMEVDLYQYADYVIKREDDLKAWLLEDYGYESVEEAKKAGETWTTDIYATALKEIRAGRVVLIGQFSDEGGDPTEIFLCHNGIQEPKRSLIKVIESEVY